MMPKQVILLFLQVVINLTLSLLVNAGLIWCCYKLERALWRWCKRLYQRLVYRPLILPAEILRYHLVPLLAPLDIANLYEALTMPISEDLYNEMFHDNTHFDHYNLRMFRERARCRLYAIGDLKKVDLALSSDYPVNYEDKKGTLGQMVTFGMVNCTENEITEVCPSQKSVEVVTSQGGIWTSRKPNDTDQMLMMPGRQNRTSNFPGGVEMPAVFEKYFSIPMAATRFKTAVSSTDDVIAVDSAGMLWRWPKNTGGADHMPALTMPFLLKDSKTGEIISGRISNLRHDLGLFACRVKGRGVVHWNNSPQHTYRCAWRNGYPCIGGLFQTVAATILPTSQNVRDFMVYGAVIVCLGSDGRVTAVDTMKDSALPFSPMNDVNSLGPFVSISSTETNSAGPATLLGEKGNVVCVRFEYSDERNRSYYNVSEIDTAGLDLAAISVSTSLADITHTLMLTKDGDVYCVGTEPADTGCLGLGTVFEAMMTQPQGHINLGILTGMEVLKPCKVPLPGKAYAVFTTESYSAVLLVNEDEKYNTIKTHLTAPMRVQVSSGKRTMVWGVSQEEIDATNGEITFNILYNR